MPQILINAVSASMTLLTQRLIGSSAKQPRIDSEQSNHAAVYREAPCSAI